MMNDNEIIKALECCSANDCKKCPYDKHKVCGVELSKDALDLINRQRVEIERLQKYNTNVAFKHYNDGKSEAIKEFAERMKEKFVNNTACGAYVRKIIDNLVKEMAGDDE